MRPCASLVLVQARHPPGDYSRRASLVVVIIGDVAAVGNTLPYPGYSEQMYVCLMLRWRRWLRRMTDGG